jgi:hypothetical protein
MMTRRIAAIAAVILGGPLVAQTTPPPANNYQPPATDSGRVPAAQATTPGSSFDGNRIPVLQGAGSGAGGFGGIQSFPDSSAGGGLQQPYVPPQPLLSPYLNLIRGTGGANISAIDYYNFVRPGQQSLGSYAGRQYGAAPGFGGAAGSRYGYNVDPETGLATNARPAGAPAVFLNYGSYFNRLGTIGTGAAIPAAQPTNNTGRR